MVAGGYFTLAVLTVLLIPIAVMSLEGRRLPDALLAVIAGCGLAISAWTGGLPVVGSAIVSSLGVIVVVGGLTALLRRKLRLWILTGGQIKLMAAGATWLDLSSMGLMLAISIIVIFAIAVWRRISKAASRPVSVLVVVFSLIISTLYQNLSFDNLVS